MSTWSIRKTARFKKLISFLLAAIICIPIYALPMSVHAAESTNLPDTLTPEMAMAYSNQLLEYPEDWELPDGWYIYAIIETLGPDRYPVLRIVKSFDGTEESLWLYENGQATKVFTKGSTGAGESTTFFISQYENTDSYVTYTHAYEWDSGDYYEIYTVESGQWKRKLKLNQEAIEENGNEKAVTQAEFDQYAGQFTSRKNVNNDGRLSNLKNGSSSAELLSPHELAQVLQNYGASQTHYDLQDKLSSLDQRQVVELQEIIGLFCKKDDSFEVGRADNSELFGLAEHLVVRNIIEEFQNQTDDYVMRIVSCETINKTMNRLLGRTIDFTPYSRESMPSEQEIKDNVRKGDAFSFSFVYNGDYYRYDLPIGYGFSWWTIEIQSMYAVGGNTYLAESSVERSEFGDRQWFGKVVSVFEKVGDDYRLVKIYPFNQYPSIEEIERYVININPESNFNIDYNEAARYTELSQYLEALRNALNSATSLNDAGNRAVTVYLDYVTQNYAPGEVSARKNTLVISSETIQKSCATARETMEQLQKELNGLTLQRSPSITARIDVTGLDFTKPMRIQLEEAAIAEISGVDNIVLVLEDNQHMVAIPADGVRQLGFLDLQLECLEADKYSISFFDKSGQIINHLRINVVFTLPASNEYSSVQAICVGYSDNWGGQYDNQNKTLTFQTSYSGEYTILEQTIQIPDIDYLSDEMQRAIKFMVSKGYFELDNEGRFNPNVILNRYEFTQALVKIFFALNLDATTSFSDVETDNPYYPYVASGEENTILAGYDDGTFKGANNILRVQMIAIGGRTLANKKGYSRPNNPAEYLNYIDSVDIPEWAESDVALSVRESLIESGGMLRPNQSINRGEAALILYRLFMLLYEVSPTPIIIEAHEVTAAPSVLPFAIGGITIVSAGGIGAVAYFILKKKKLTSKG